MTDRTFMSLTGLASDVVTVHQMLRQRVNLYAMKEERTIEPETYAQLVSSTLYERRYALLDWHDDPDIADDYSNRFGPFFIEPIVAGKRPLRARLDLRKQKADTAQV